MNPPNDSTPAWTDSQIATARALAAALAGRWAAGMRFVNPDTLGSHQVLAVRLHAHGDGVILLDGRSKRKRWLIRYDVPGLGISGWLPDVTDPATFGACVGIIAGGRQNEDWTWVINGLSSAKTEIA